jgi:hypothetical protein
MADVQRIIEASARPPDKRTKEFELVATTVGSYWRLRAPTAEVY